MIAEAGGKVRYPASTRFQAKYLEWEVSKRNYLIRATKELVFLHGTNEEFFNTVFLVQFCHSNENHHGMVEISRAYDLCFF